jgi:hypothetical protein
MPVSIPAGTKFEAIKPTTNVNRRSALVNANDLTYTIEDIAAAAGGTFPITNNYIPKANNVGSIIDSNLYELAGVSGDSLNGSYDGGLYINYQSSVPLLNIFGSAISNSYISIGDIFGAAGPSWGISLESSALTNGFLVYTNGISILEFYPDFGTYNFGGLSTRFGILNADGVNSSLSVSTDLVVDILGTKYIKVDVNGTIYNIALVP